MTGPDAGRSYRCEKCGGTFIALRSDAEAEAEARVNFGVDHASTDPTMAQICDDCYEQLMAWLSRRDGRRR